MTRAQAQSRQAHNVRFGLGLTDSEKDDVVEYLQPLRSLKPYPLGLFERLHRMGTSIRIFAYLATAWQSQKLRYRVIRSFANRTRPTRGLLIRYYSPMKGG